ncbi:MAG: DNA alkylation repair protein [Leadbetterella sp.]
MHTVISPEILQRKGATSFQKMPKEVIELLNQGLIPTVNLMEWLSVDQNQLLKNVFSDKNLQFIAKFCFDEIDKLKKPSALRIQESIGKSLGKLEKEFPDHKILHLLSNHVSDVVRCWGGYAVAEIYNHDTRLLFDKIYIFAADIHFGVREIAWMAIRNHIIQHLENSLAILTKFTQDSDPNIRRFASEATRPRGVWCNHIEELKSYPQKGISILEPLMNDESKYVQDSVGNWLNDASKTQAIFVKEFCDKYIKKDSKSTVYIIKRGMRSIVKK